MAYNPVDVAYSILRFTEGDNLFPYEIGGHATISIGVDMLENSDAMLNSLGIIYVSHPISTIQSDENQAYIHLKNLISTPYPNGLPAGFVSEFNSFASKSSAPTVKLPITQSQSEKLFKDTFAAVNSTIIPLYSRVTDPLELGAIYAAAYNGKNSLVGTGTNFYKDLHPTNGTAPNRAEAWYQLRYFSNKERENKKPVFSHGLENARIYESQMFGLYNGRSSSIDLNPTVTEVEAVQALELVGDHPNIIQLDAQYVGAYNKGNPPSTIPASESISAGQIESLNQFLMPALKYMVKAYDSASLIAGQFSLSGVYGRSGDLSNGGSTSVAAPSNVNGNEIVFGSGDGQSIQGSAGHQDLIIGFGFGDTLTGGNKLNIMTQQSNTLFAPKSNQQFTFNSGAAPINYIYGLGSDIFNLDCTKWQNVDIVYDGSGNNVYNLSPGSLGRGYGPNGAGAVKIVTVSSPNLSIAQFEQFAKTLNLYHGANCCTELAVVVILDYHSSDTIKIDGNAIAGPGNNASALNTSYTSFSSVSSQIWNTTLYGGISGTANTHALSINAGPAAGSFAAQYNLSADDSGSDPSADVEQSFQLGGDGPDQFSGSPTGSYIQDSGGGDRFNVGASDTATIINEVDTSADPDNVLAFSVGIDPSSVSVVGDATGDLVLSVSGTNQVTLQEALNSTPGQTYGVQQVTFADGTSWSYSQLLAMAETPSAANTSLYGDGGANLLDSQGLATYEQGGGGDDTFVYNAGYGPLTINEVDTSATPDNVLAFGTGIDPSSVTVTGDAAGDLILSLGGSDQITLQGALASVPGQTYGVQQVTFSNGTSWSYAQLLAMAETPSTANTSLYGDGGANLFDSQGLAHTAVGGGGGDTFVYNAGYGQLTINEIDTSDTPDNVLAFGSGIDPAAVSVYTNASGDLLLSLGGADVISLQNALNSTPGQTYGVQQVTFADGTNWSYAQLVAMAETPSATNTSLYGDGTANLLDSHGLATYEQGGGGGDTFVYDTGYGSLTINEVDTSAAPDNVLAFGTGIDPSSVSVTSDAAGDLILSLGGTDRVILQNMAESAYAGVQSVSFADGDVWSAAALLAKANNNVLSVNLIAASNDSAVAGFSGPYGSYGDVVIGPADFSIINEVSLDTPSTEWSVSIAQSDPNTVVLTDTSQATITFSNLLSTGGARMPPINFSDGVTWNYSQLLATLETPSATGAPIVGDSGANLLDTLGQVSTAIGGGGGDTFIFDAGYGPLTINEVDASSSPNNILSFGAGIAAADVAVSSDSNGDVILTLSGSDEVTLLNQLDSAAGQAVGVQEVVFADGTTWSAAQIATMAATSSSPPDGGDLYGDSGANLLDPKGVYNYIEGEGGGDTFVFNAGYGAVEINEIDTSSTPANVLQLGSGILPSAVTVEADSTGDLILTLGGGDEITLDNALNSAAGQTYGVQQVTFADGTSWSYAQLLAMADTPSATNTSLYGDGGANLLDSQGLATYEQGGGGGDTFVYNPGYGPLTINEFDTAAAPNNVLAFGAGVDPSSVSVTGDVEGDLILSLNASDQVILQGALSSTVGQTYGVQQVTFSDGTTWSYAQLLAMAETPSATNTSLYGDGGANLLDSQGLATYEQGGGGGDTFVYNAGYGPLTINEFDTSDAPDNVVAFGTGIDPSSVSVTGDAAGDLILFLDGSDQVTLQGALTSTPGQTYGVQRVTFADGTSWSYAQLLAMAGDAGGSATAIYGDGAANLLDTQGQAHAAVGGGGGDTFVYNAGYGQLAINELDTSDTPDNVLAFGSGIDPSGVSVTGDTAGDLILSLGGSDQITLQGALNSTPGQTYGVQQVTFFDGTTWSYAQLLAKVDTASAANTSLYGDGGANLLDSQGLATYEQGGGGGDTFVYDTGYGPLTINEVDTSAAPDNVLAFGAGIDPSNVSVTSDADGDIILTLGGSDQITLVGALNSTPDQSNGVEQVTFADGTTWSAGDLQSYATAVLRFTEGEGAIVVNPETGPDGGVPVVAFDQTISPADFTVSVGGELNTSLVVGLDGADSVTFENALTAGLGSKTLITFTDGTSYTYTQLLAMADLGSVTNTSLYGDGGANLLDSQGLATYEQGGGGGDTFVYNAGYGPLTINEVDTAATPNNTLAFGARIDPSGVSVAGDASGDLILSLDGTDQITLQGALNSTPGQTYGVQQVTFADGTSWSYAQLLAMADTPSAANTSLYGDGGANLLDSQGLATYEQGGGGGDTFVYNTGYGPLTINELDASATPDNVLAFGTGIDPSSVSVTGDAAGDLILSLGGSDQITLQGALASASAGVQLVTFADGTTWTGQDLLDQAETGSPTNTTIYGTPGADLIDSKGFGEYSWSTWSSTATDIGGGGGDTFIFDSNYDAVTIDEVDNPGAPNDILELGPNTSESQVSVSADSAGDLIIKDGYTSATVQGELLSTGQVRYGIQEVVFNDGTTWTLAQLMQIADTGSPQNQGALYGDSAANLIDSQGFATYEQGGGGGDSFVYNPGYGPLTINELDTSAAPDNVLAFGAGIDPSSVSVTGDASGDLILSVSSTDRVTLQGALNSVAGQTYGVQQVTFSDGTTWSYAQLLAMAETPSNTNTALYGDGGANLLDSQGLATYEQGGGGGDTFVYNPGYGPLTIAEHDTSASPDNVLAFGAGVDPSSVSVTGDAAGDLILSLGGSDQIVLQGALNSTAGQTYGVQEVTFSDGTSWSYGTLVRMADTGSPTNEALYGDSNPDIFDSRGFATYEKGTSGNDAFIYNSGYGPLTIDETYSQYGAIGFTDPNSFIAFGSGITASDLSVSGDSAGDVILSLGASDVITLESMMNTSLGEAYGVQNVFFADGSHLTASQLLNMADIGSPTNTRLYGGYAATVFDSRGYATYEYGGGGADTFIYNPGYGAVEINESSYELDGVLQLGPGITLANLKVGQDVTGDYVLTDGVAGDSITIDGMGSTTQSYDNQMGVASVSLADGTLLNFDQIEAMSLIGSPTNTYDVEVSGTHVFDSRGYARYEQGDGNADTFIYNQSYGQLEINESSNWENGLTGTLQLGPGITTSNISVASDMAGDLIIGDGVAGDEITIDAAEQQDWLGNYTNGVASLSFADGTILTNAQLIAMAMIGSPENTQLYGTAGPDLLDSRGYATYAQGDGGADTFIYDAGYGNLEVADSYDGGWTPAPAGIIAFGSAIDEVSLAASLDSSGDLTITDGVAGDALKIDQMGDFDGQGQQTQGVTGAAFADGTTWTAQQLLDLAFIGSTTNTTIYGTSGADVFDPRGFANYVQGNGGSDTFIYNSGYGALEVNEDAGDYSDSTAVLQFGPGIAANDITATEDDQGDILLGDGISGDTIKLDGEATMANGYANCGVAGVSFSDGTTLTAQQLIDLALTGPVTNDSLFGSSGADYMDGKGVAYYEQGNGGSDTFVYNPGYGALEINEDAGAYQTTSAILQLGAGITPTDTVLSTDSSDDLILTDGLNGDQITLDNELDRDWGSSGEYGVQAIKFADGTTWNILNGSNLDLVWNGAAGDLDLSGLSISATNTFIGGNGDVLNGVNSDIYELGSTAGSETINSSGNANSDSIVFDSSINKADVTLQAVGSSLIITDAAANVTITVNNEFWSSWWGGNNVALDTINFADGTSWNFSGDQNLDLTWDGTAGDQTLTGSSWGTLNTFLGGAEDTLNGVGTDLYKFGDNAGAETINLGANDSVTFGGSVTSSDLWFVQSGSDLQIDQIGTTNQIIMSNWANDEGALTAIDASDGLQLDSQLNALINAMATYTADNPGFNPITAPGMPTDSNLQSSLAAAWHTR